MITQEIRFELNGNGITPKQVESLHVLTTMITNHDMRVVDDQGILKIYVGPHNRETHRFWVGPKGILSNPLVEKDLAVETDDSKWDQVDWSEAEAELSGRTSEFDAETKATIDLQLKEISFASLADALKVIDALQQVNDQEGEVSVADLYDLLGVIGQFVDNKFGWPSLYNLQARQDGMVYVLTLPPVVKL